MPNNRYSDPLAYSITNNPGGSYSFPRIDYTSMFDRASEIARAAPSIASSWSSPVQTSGSSSCEGGSLLRAAGKLAGIGLLAGLVILAAEGTQKQKK